jgi:TRAP-type transport system small permease protein
LEKLISAVERTAGMALLAIALLTFGSVVMRYVFSSQIPDWFDLSKLLQGIAIFWGIACVCYRNEHILVDLVWEKSNDANKRRIDLIATTVVLIFLTLMAYMLAAKTFQVLQSTQATSDLRLPVGPFHVVAWMGTVAAAVLTLLRLIHLWRNTHPQSDIVIDQSNG